MNFEQLEYIVTVANEQSVTKAANKLFISPSGLSQSITQLEKELGINIFNRTKQGITPTFQGEIVISKAVSLLKTFKELKEEILHSKKVNQKHFKLLYAPTFYFVLEELIVPYYRENPDITFELEERNVTEIIKNFNKGDYDFALVPATKEELRVEKNIQYIHLFQGEICIAVGKSSPFYSFDYVSRSDLKDAILMIYSSQNLDAISKFTKLKSNQSFIKINKSRILFDLVKESQTVTYVHDFTIKDHPLVLNGDIKIIPVIEEGNFFSVDFWVIYHELKGLTEEVRHFINKLIHQIDYK